MKAANKKFDFVINTLPLKGEFEKYFETVAKGGIFVQVGMPAVADWNLKI
jgi:D-arabinose 1-dehydrogenase-like Zn-dependent alcohol dehydrogenase